MALVLYIYANEFAPSNWKPIAAGLVLYVVHWLYKILNALIQHFSGYALWTVPTGTAFLLLIGINIVISWMLSVAGLIMRKFLPADPKLKIAGLNKRLLFTLVNAACFAAAFCVHDWPLGSLYPVGRVGA